MSRARHSTHKAHEGKEHHKRASGGALPEIAGGDPQVLADVKSKKNVGVIEGEKSKKRGDRMAVKKGGAVKRAAGGSVKGADLSPFSSAHDGGPKNAAGSENEAHEGAHKRGGRVHKRANGGEIGHHGSHPVHKDEHGEAVKKALKKGGRC